MLPSSGLNGGPSYRFPLADYRLPPKHRRGRCGRWTAGKCYLTKSPTWNAFAVVPCQVGGGKGYLERFRGGSFRSRWEAGKATWNAFAVVRSVPGGRRERLLGTLLREFRGRWTAGTYCGAPPGLPALRAPSLLGSRCRLRP